MFVAVTPNTPVSTVHIMSYPVTALPNRRFRDALNSCNKAERIFMPVRQCAPGLKTEITVRKCVLPAGFINYRADGGKNQRSRESIKPQPFTSLRFRGE